MKASLINKLKQIASRFGEVGGLLSDADVMNDQNRFRELSKEYAHLGPIIACFETYQKNVDAIEAAKAMLAENDAGIRKLADEELSALKAQQSALEDQLQLLLLPADPNDERNVYLEIRAGTGGDEAAIFVG